MKHYSLISNYVIKKIQYRMNSKISTFEYVAAWNIVKVQYVVRWNPNPAL